MGEIIGAGIALAILAIIGTVLIVSEKKRNSHFKDDGFIWPEHLEELRKKVQH
ncbi:MAG: hypothetical protein IJR16_07595 [Spirochaetales bacterium]|nr:hypothetical protein [Spirochaetales bacterium]